MRDAHLADLFASEACALDLLLIADSLFERLREVVDVEVADVRADAESGDAVGVEMLVPEERLDDGREPGCGQKW